VCVWVWVDRTGPPKKVMAARKTDDVRKGDMAALDYSQPRDGSAPASLSDAPTSVPAHLVDADAMARLRAAAEGGAYELAGFDVPAVEDDDDDPSSTRSSTGARARAEEHAFTDAHRHRHTQIHTRPHTQSNVNSSDN
jgi:hypothetical protein